MYIIEDWAGNLCDDGNEFESFEEARARIDDLATIECNNNFKPDTKEWEELYQALQEDLYAIEVK